MKSSFLLIVNIVFFLSGCTTTNIYGETELTWMSWLGIIFLILLIWMNISAKLKQRRKNKYHDHDGDKRDVAYQFFENQRLESEEKIKLQTKNFDCFNVAVKGLYYRTSPEQQRARKLFIGEEVFLEREYNNPKDKFAVRVITNDRYFIGYVDIDKSKEVAGFINDGIKRYCFIAKVTSNHIPYVYMNLYYDIETINRREREKEESLEKKKREKELRSTLYTTEEKDRIKRLRENIYRSEVALSKFREENKIVKMNNAAKRLQEYRGELKLLENRTLILEKAELEVNNTKLEVEEAKHQLYLATQNGDMEAMAKHQDQITKLNEELNKI